MIPPATPCGGQKSRATFSTAPLRLSRIRAVGKNPGAPGPKVIHTLISHLPSARTRAPDRDIARRSANNTPISVIRAKISVNRALIRVNNTARFENRAIRSVNNAPIPLFSGSPKKTKPRLSSTNPHFPTTDSSNLFAKPAIPLFSASFPKTKP
jgi:hypothetical protein